MPCNHDRCLVPKYCHSPQGGPVPTSRHAPCPSPSPGQSLTHLPSLCIHLCWTLHVNEQRHGFRSCTKTLFALLSCSGAKIGKLLPSDPSPNATSPGRESLSPARAERAGSLPAFCTPFCALCPFVPKSLTPAGLPHTAQAAGFVLSLSP